MARLLVVETAYVVLCAHRDICGIELDKPGNLDRSRLRRREIASIGGKQRVASQVVLQVCEHQLLMLLLVMQAQREGIAICITSIEKRQHGVVDV